MADDVCICSVMLRSSEFFGIFDSEIILCSEVFLHIHILLQALVHYQGMRL